MVGSYCDTATYGHRTLALTLYMLLECDYNLAYASSD
jgi:hypothetical protein